MKKYNVVIFFKDKSYPLKYRNVSNFEKLIAWVEINLQGGKLWSYANLYDSRTSLYIKRVYNN